MKVWKLNLKQNSKFSVDRILFVLLLLLVIISRFYRLDFPPTYVFDEIYHVTAAKLSLNNDQRLYEWWHPTVEKGFYFDWLHPPVAKYLQAFSMKILAASAFAWRLPSALAGLLLIVVIYYFAQFLFKKKSVAWFAAFFLATDGLVLLQSRLAMNDIFLTLFLLLAVFSYAWRRQISHEFQQRKDLLLLLTGFFLGLALATKWSALLIILLLFFWELRQVIIGRSYLKIPWTFFSLIFLPLIIYVLSYAQIFFQGKGLVHLIKLHQQIWWYQHHREGHFQASGPLEWIVNQKLVYYWRPSVNFIADNQDLAVSEQGITLSANTAFLFCGLLAVVATMIKLFYNWQQQRDLAIGSVNEILLLLLLVYFASFLPWILAPRVMFLYHYLPALPFLALLLAFWLGKLWQVKRLRPLVYAVLIYISVFFIQSYSSLTGLLIFKT